MKKKSRVTIIIIFALLLLINTELKSNASIKVLMSVINFSESTLKNSNYLAYNIDLKDLFRNYTNSDIRYSGNAYIKQVKGFPYSISGSINGERSSSQKKFSCKANLDVLVLNVGELDVYAEDEILYLVAPLLGGISYGFDTGEDLFLKAPNLSNNLNQEWFHNNKKNIYDFVRKIQIEKTDNIYVDDDGVESIEYTITIPEGEGDFIWELLDMKAPGHDIKCSIFLDKWNHTRKLVFDLSYKSEGCYISIYGENLSALEIYAPLPDDELMTATIKRNGEVTYTNSFTDNITYYASNGDIYSIDCNVVLDYTEDGIKTEVTDINVNLNNTVLASGYVKGEIVTADNMGDVFENAGADLSNVTVIDWDTIKNDTASFVDDVISQARENVNLFDFLK